MRPAVLQSSGMDPRRIAFPRTGRRIALAASVLTHALVAGLWLHNPPHKPHMRVPERAHAAHARVTLRLYSAPQRAPAPLAVAPAPPEPIRPERAKPPRPRVRPAAAAAAPVRPPAIEAPPPAATTSPVAAIDPAPAASATAGAAFAGLFAPIVSRPIGNGGWGRRRVDPPPAPDPQAQREQALLALRMALLGRLNDLAGRLGEARRGGQDLQCDIAIDGVHHTAEVRCADPADQGAPWSALQGLLAAGTVPATNADLCFRLVGSQVSSQACAADTPVPASPDGVKSSEHRGTGFAGPLVLPP
jgi:hypothetical protein